MPLSEYCQELFGSLPRSDQRRWGEVYVRGLISVPGRKSIRHIAQHVVGRPVEQSLQQFVNQSPWPWDTVRRALARRAAELTVHAWVLRDAVFPKSGTKSVGVARQYVASAGRTLNCQRALAVIMAGEGGSCVVNWRLLLPACWDDDPDRRAHTGVPARERHRPRWQHVLDMIDEMSSRWGLRPPLLVLDADRADARALRRGLRARRLRYLIRVPGARWQKPTWLTNLATTAMPDFARLVALSERARREDFDRLCDDFGLLDFEGRSFAGWQHHVTLASVAHAYRVLRRSLA